MAIVNIAGITGASFSDNIFYYKWRDTAVPVGTLVTWSLALYNPTNYKTVNLRSVVDAAHETFIDLSDVLSAEVSALQGATLPAGHEEKYLTYNLSFTTPAGTYAAAAAVYVFYGKLSRVLKQRPYISGRKNYFDLILNSLGGGMPAQTSAVAYMYRRGTKYLSFHMSAYALVLHPTITMIARYYIDGVEVQEVTLLEVNADEYVSLAGVMTMVYAPLIDAYGTDWDYCTVALYGTSDAQITELVTVYPKYVKLPAQSKTFVWKNSRSGYSSIQTAGAHTQLHRPTGGSIAQSYGFIDHTKPNVSLLSAYDLSADDQYTTYSGYLIQAEVDELKELIKNPIAFILEGGVMNAIEVLSSEIEVANSETYNYQLKINWRYQL